MYPIGSSSGRQVVGDERRPDDAVDLADADRARALARRQRLGSRIDGAGADDEVGARLGEQLDEAGDRRVDLPRVDAALVAGRGLRAQAEAGRADPDPDVRNHAISRATVVVASLISVSAPPMIPPMPIGRSSASQMSRSSAAQAAGHVVERRDLLAIAGPPDAEAVAAQRRQVVGVVGLAELEHHVVADVDDVVDRAHAGRGEALGHPRCRRPDRHAIDHRRREAAAAVAVDDLDRRHRTAVGDLRLAGVGGVNATPSLAARSRATPT